MGTRALLLCIWSLPTSVPERRKKGVKGSPKYSQDSALGVILSPCVCTEQDGKLLDQEEQFALMSIRAQNC